MMKTTFRSTAEAVLAAVLASAAEPVLVTDREGRLLLANQAARQALDSRENSLEGMPIDPTITEQGLRDLLLDPGNGKKSAIVPLADGKVYFATAVPFVVDAGQAGRVCVLKDVTHFKELDDLKSEFVSMVSHDLRSPLTLIRGYTTMLEMVGELNEQQRKYIAKITTGVETMARQVDTLLDLGRIEAGVDLQIDRVPLMEVVNDVVNMLQLQARHKEIDLALEVGSGLPQSIDADRALLQQALYNLVENAIKYTPTGGWVKLNLKAYPEAIQFEVQDNGIGISPADQPRLFEKFFRGRQREARAQHGSGLGLAIVRSIAERHAGKVWMESKLGEGSTFFLLMPYRRVEKTAPDPQAI
jgi:signal transduction histidine kinase